MEKEIKGYIYKITNIQNGFCYIGKTIKDINKRFQAHKYAASISKGSRESLQQAIRKYGEDKFKIELIDTIYAPDSLEEAERKYIKKYHSWIEDPECKGGYNLSKGGQGGLEISEELLKKIVNVYEEVKNQMEVARRLDLDVSTVRNYLKMSGVNRDDAKTVAINITGKKVAIYDDNNKLIAIYPSIGEAARHFKDQESASHISEVCYGKRRQVRGYKAKFTDDEVFNENYILPTLMIQNLKPKKKSVAMIDIDTGKSLQIFESGCAAGRFFQMPRPASATTCIKRAIQRNGTWRGYKWAYV